MRADKEISALALVLLVLSSLDLRFLLGQLQTIFPFDLSHGLLTLVEISLHLYLALESLCGEDFEGFFDIDILPRWSLQKLHALSLGILLCLLFFDAAIFLIIDLVANNHERERLRHAHHRLLKERIFPIWDVVKRPIVGDVVDQKSTVSPSVERSS